MTEHQIRCRSALAKIRTTQPASAEFIRCLLACNHSRVLTPAQAMWVDSLVITKAWSVAPKDLVDACRSHLVELADINSSPQLSLPLPALVTKNTAPVTHLLT